jgi:PAS domain-containing protein
VRSAAHRVAVAALGSVGIAELSVRGTIVSADADFAALVGFPSERLIGVRVTDLLTLATRVPVAGAVEQVLSQGRATALDACLLINGEGERPARISLAPLNEGYVIGGAMMAVA